METSIPNPIAILTFKNRPLRIWPRILLFKNGRIRFWILCAEIVELESESESYFSEMSEYESESYFFEIEESEPEHRMLIFRIIALESESPFYFMKIKSKFDVFRNTDSES